MSNRAQSYAEITKAVERLVDHHVENDPTVAAYMIARAAILQVRGLRGSEAAAALAYKIADEMVAEAV